MKKEELLQKYLDGLSSPQEERQLYNLLRKEDDNQAYQHITFKLWEKLKHQEVDSTRRERMYHNIARQTTAAKQKKPYFQWAAAIVLLIAATGLLFYFINKDLVQYETSLAEQRSFQLPDGSQVELNEASKLHFQDDWQEKGVREVWLEGEAFFKVSKQKNSSDQPTKFIVHAGELDIIVLGTAFNVQSSPTEVQVVLSEGAVRLENPEAQIKMDMEPGDMVAYSAIEKQAEMKRVKTRHFSAWKDGRYVFEGLTLEEVSQVLWHNYGKEVKLGSEELKQRRFSATIPSTDLQVVLAIIEEAMKVEITQQGDTIIIK